MINQAAVVASAFVFLSSLCPAVRAGGILDEEREQKYSVGANPSLTVRNTDGRVLVYGSEAGQITVKIYKRAFTQDRLSKIEANISMDGDAMKIDTNYPPPAKGVFADRSGTVEYTLLVPQNCAVNVEQSQGEILLKDLRGPSIDARLANGRINVRSCFSPARVQLGYGGIDITFNWWEKLPFAMSFEVDRGDVELLLPPPAGLRLDAATQNGHIRKKLVADSQDEDVQQLNTTIGDPTGAEFKIRTAEGNIKIGKAY